MPTTSVYHKRGKLFCETTDSRTQQQTEYQPGAVAGLAHLGFATTL